MPAVEQLITFVVASAVLGITPGPDIIYVVVRGAAQGPRAGIAAAAGLCTGIIAHTAFAVIGLTAILAASATAFTVVKLAGAAYLVYLGVRMLVGRDELDFSGDGKQQPLGAIYRQTILMNILNPKVGLFFLAFLPQFIDPAAGPAAPQFALLGTIFMAVSFVVMAGAGMAGGQLRRWLATSARATRVIQYTAGTILVALGLRLALEKA
jgi:threonine/homoserine/homoserine lactone efflux protein